MKLTETKADRYALGVIAYVIAPALSVLFIYASLKFATLVFQQEDLRLPRSALALALLVIGMGLLQFSYLIFFKKEVRLSNSILYLASVAFMIFGAFAAIYPIIAPSDGVSAAKSVRGAGVFFIGLLALAYVRKRKKQSSQPMPPSRRG